MSAFRTPATALAVIAAAGLLFAAHGPLQAQGHYSPVTKEDVPAMRLSRYFPPEKQD